MFHPAPSAENEAHPVRCECPLGGVLDVHLQGKCLHTPEFACCECGRHLCDLCAMTLSYHVPGAEEGKRICLECLEKYRV